MTKCRRCIWGFHKSIRPKDTLGHWGSRATLDKQGRDVKGKVGSSQVEKEQHTWWTNLCRVPQEHWDTEEHLTDRLAWVPHVCGTSFKYAAASVPRSPSWSRLLCLNALRQVKGEVKKKFLLKVICMPGWRTLGDAFWTPTPVCTI